MPQCNIPAFDQAAERLRKVGHDVVSPAELDDPEVRERMLNDETGVVSSLNWAQCLGRDIEVLDTCDGIVLLPGWECSKGAKLETYAAILRGKAIYRFGSYTSVCPLCVLDALVAATNDELGDPNGSI
jgi:hypothetical protein